MRYAALTAGLVLLPLFASGAAPPVRVTKPWVRYLLPSIPAAGYMTLKNDGATDIVLKTAASPACAMLMLHQSQDNSGMATMLEVGTITIPAHGTVSLAPGGYHLMCMQPRMKIGDNVTLRLTFADGSRLDVAAPVYGAQSAP
jgi:copper(I)-binding protein